VGTVSVELPIELVSEVVVLFTYSNYLPTVMAGIRIFMMTDYLGSEEFSGITAPVFPSIMVVAHRGVTFFITPGVSMI